MFMTLRAPYSGLLLGLVLVTSCTSPSTTTLTETEIHPTTFAVKVADDRLSRYSIEELRDILKKRRQKTVYTDSNLKTLNDVSESHIIDALRAREKVIYGTDRRRDYFDISHPLILAASNSVLAFVPPAKYALSQNGLSLLTRPLGAVMGLCSGEPFFDQPTAPVCTGFVIGENLVASAGHCISENWRAYRLVFGFRAQRSNDENALSVVKYKTAFLSEDVFSITDIVARVEEPDGLDYSVVRVDRPITGHSALALNVSKPLRPGDGVYVLGYPSGLPLKLGDDAAVRQVSDRGLFTANLDTFAGNSGSPVFNASSHEVEGILVRGDTDYKSKGSCNVSMVCPNDGCTGETATSVEKLKNLLARSKARPTENSLQPFSKVFTSEPKLSGVGKRFSSEYEISSEPAPAGYQIKNYTFSLEGDRTCGNWASCNAQVVGDRVVFRFALQGHDDWLPPGQTLSRGHLVVTYGPPQ